MKGAHRINKGYARPSKRSSQNKNNYKNRTLAYRKKTSPSTNFSLKQNKSKLYNKSLNTSYTKNFIQRNINMYNSKNKKNTSKYGNRELMRRQMIKESRNNSQRDISYLSNSPSLRSKMISRNETPKRRKNIIQKMERKNRPLKISKSNKPTSIK